MDIAEAQALAAASAAQSEADLGHQRAALKEERQTLWPMLHRLREHNHVADALRTLIGEEDRRDAPGAG
jgi:hypothetical protein